MSTLCDNTRVARKPHRCEECWKTINPGERYHRYVGTWEGDFFTNQACLHCSAARRILNAVCDNYNDTYYGGLCEGLDCCWQDHDEPIGLGRLLVGVRAQWVYRSGRPMPIPGAAA